MKNNLEEVWNEEYKNFMLSFYPESSPLVSTWEIYRMAKIKSQKEIKNLLELTETLNQIRDNLQDENRNLSQELQNTREQFAEAVDLLRRIKNACSPSDILAYEQELEKFLEKQNRE